MVRSSMKASLILFALGVFFLVYTVAAQDVTPTPTPNAFFGTLLDTTQGTPTVTAHANTGSLPVSGLLERVEFGRREDDGAFYLGDINAPIGIVLFADWACPHCIEYRSTVSQMIREYVLSGMAYFEMRMFPTAGGRDSVINGMIAECTDQYIMDNQERAIGFWLANDLLYQLAERERYGNEDMLSLYTRFLQVEQAPLLECVNDLRPPQVLTDIQFGIDHGVSGTPAVMVRYADDAEPQFITYDDHTYSGGGVPFEVLSAVILEANGLSPETTPEAGG